MGRCPRANGAWRQRAAGSGTAAPLRPCGAARRRAAIRRAGRTARRDAAPRRHRHARTSRRTARAATAPAVASRPVSRSSPCVRVARASTAARPSCGINPYGRRSGIVSGAARPARRYTSRISASVVSISSISAASASAPGFACEYVWLPSRWPSRAILVATSSAPARCLPSTKKVAVHDASCSTSSSAGVEGPGPSSKLR